jgi:hypothetical protein
MKTLIISTLILTLLTGSTIARNSSADEALEDLTTIGVKIPYSASISEMYLAYDENDKIQVGIATRPIKSYKMLTGQIVVRKETGYYVIEAAEITDLDKIKHPKQRTEIKRAIAVLEGTRIDPAAPAFHVDGLTGATRYRKKVLTNFSIMAKMLVAEMEKDPDWPKESI